MRRPIPSFPRAAGHSLPGVLAAVLLSAPSGAVDRPPAATGAASAAPDFLRETAPGEGLHTGEEAEVRLLVESGRPLRVVLSQLGRGAAESPSSGNDLDLEVVGPDGPLAGYALPGEVGEGPGALPFEHVDVAAADITPGVWTVRVVGAWVPQGPEGYRLSVEGEVQEVVPPVAERPGAKLAQCDPNPVRDHTTIRFTLARPGDILLAVYDIAGRPVRTLVSGGRARGEHSAAWDGRDETGDRVAPGIYFYRLEGDRVDVTRKLVVVR